jgi:F-box/TPR repeat protein Pof3
VKLHLTGYSICLAVSKSWKLLLESSHQLWTTFDTTYTRKPISQTSLKVHLRRSNYTLDKAVISMKAKFDATKMKYLTRTCKKLRHLEISGIVVIGDSLTAALPLAQSLQTLILSRNCEISLAAVHSALKACQKTLVAATFLRVKGSRTVFIPDQWPELQLLRVLHLRSSGDAILDAVSANLRHANTDARLGSLTRSQILDLSH